MGSYDGIILSEYITGLYYGIVLRNHIMELYYEIILMKRIPGIPGEPPESDSSANLLHKSRMLGRNSDKAPKGGW